MRQRLLQRLDFLGLVLDDERNADVKLSAEKPVARVSAEVSRVAALAVRTDEELSIAHQTMALLRDRKRVKNPGPIPIAISARHLHLDAASFATLFGKDAKPTHHKDISQPGQYACVEKVNLIGPRNRIDGVRLLGPLRKRNQVEVSRTDEFALGVDAPIRDSGNTEGSAPITLEGPKGSLTLTEGLICAKRHVHMTPDDAAAYGVMDGDEVEISVRGGPRDVVFGDVLIRVHQNYRLEMHLDTDEANAAELNPGAKGELGAYTLVTVATASLERRRVKE
jgi:acetate kinase